MRYKETKRIEDQQTELRTRSEEVTHGRPADHDSSTCEERTSPSVTEGVPHVRSREREREAEQGSEAHGRSDRTCRIHREAVDEVHLVR